MTTVNNLQLHLNWFLGSSAHIPSLHHLHELPYQVHPTPALESSIHPLEDAATSRALSVNNFRGPVASQPSGSVQVDPEVPTRSQNMAKLRVAPAATTKPTLLSTQPHSVSASTTNQSTETFRDGASKTTEPTASGSKACPLRSNLDLPKKKFAHVEAIDLTGDDEKKSFAEVSPIGQSARKKRKSEELGFSGSGQSFPRTKAARTHDTSAVNEDFMAIDDVSDESLTCSNTVGTKSSLTFRQDEQTGKVQSPPDQARSLSSHSEDVFTVVSTVRTETTPDSLSTPSKNKKPVSTRVLSPSKASVNNPKCGVPHAGGEDLDLVKSRTVSPTRNKTRSVFGSPVGLHVDSGKNFTWDNHSQSLEQQLFASKEALGKTPGKVATSAQKQRPQLSPSPTNSQHATSDDPGARAPDSSTESIAKKLTDSQRQALQGLLNIPLPVIEKRASEIDQELKPLLYDFYEAWTEGRLSDDLKTQTACLKRQHKALKDIFEARNAYLRAHKRQHKLKTAVMAHFEDMCSGTINPQTQDEHKILAVEVRNAEHSLFALAKDACLINQHGDLMELPCGKSQVMVQATQPASVTEPVGLKRDQGYHHDFVEQTQLPFNQGNSKRSLSPQKLDKKHLNPVVHVQETPTKSSKKRKKDDVACQPIDGFHTTDENEDVDEFMESDILFSTRMGSPPHQVVEDVEQDDDDEFNYSDDCDMLEAVEHAENGTSKAVDRTQGTTKQLKFAHDLFTLPTMQHPWSKDVANTLRLRFKLVGFRPNQLEAINATLSGQHAFVLMPTGGGKSLCYQLPALIESGKTRGVTVVVSPLMSLMQDQVNHLRKLQIQAFCYNSDTTREQKQELRDALQGPRPHKFVQLLYIAPEMLSRSDAMIGIFKKLYDRHLLARIVVDEAHCVSQWGHDFRPDYTKVGEHLSHFKGVPIMALTATATVNVKADTKEQLAIGGCEEMTQSFNRPNLTYEIRPKSKSKECIEEMAKLIRTQHRNQCGIIYCLARQTCEDVAKQLREKHSISAYHYHAMLDSAQRSRVQEQWQAGRYKVIVATIAFGMGIDKPDVRFVIHHTLPKSLEGYYQETGRAGRDGKLAKCYMFYKFGDCKSLESMIEKGDGNRQTKERQIDMVRNVVHFCENVADCRRKQILAYFSEKFDPANCNRGCDNCLSGLRFRKKNFTNLAAAAIRIVQQTKDMDQDVTLLHVVDILLGKNLKKIRELKHDQLPEFGTSKGLDRNDPIRVLHRLELEDGIAMRRVNYNNGGVVDYIQPGKKANAFKNQRVQIELDVPITSNGRQETCDDSSKRTTAPKQRFKTGTGLPPSTNVSSPVQGGPQNGLDQFKKPKPPNMKKKRGPIDSLMARDEESSDSDAFEPLGSKLKRPSTTKSRGLGKPITGDTRMDELEPARRDIVEAFVQQGKKECQRLLTAKNLRSQPFTESMLREMFIKLPQSRSEMCHVVTDIDPERVEAYGDRFLRLVKNCQETIAEFAPHPDVDQPALEMEEDEDALFDEQDFDSDYQEDGDDGQETSTYHDAEDGVDSLPKPADPNHCNVISLLSEDEEERNEGWRENDGDDDYGSDVDFDLDESSHTTNTRSAYFPDESVQAFNSRFAQTQPPPRSPSPQATTNRARSSKNFSKGKSGGTGKWKAGKKSGKSGSKPGPTAPKPSKKTGGGRGGIGMMPM